jgi:hypothetical protein
MFAFVLCLFALLATASLAQPAERDSSAEPPAAGQPLCGLVQSAASAPQLEEEEGTRAQEEEIPGEASPERQFPIRSEELSPAELLRLRTNLQLFETSLVNWRHFEDLAPKQRTMIGGVLARCGAAGTSSLAASVFEQFNASQRTTFVSTTHAMQNTHIIDSRDGKDWGDALQLVEALHDIQGENNGLPSDKQFQVIVRLAPDALQKLERAAHFEKGENHIFHKEYPISFRQFRKMGLRGQEAGLHICVTRDGRLAQIHIDYRFGLLHLGPANSDVRANGNHQRHVDRWPQFRLVQKHVKVRRPVLH